MLSSESITDDNTMYAVQQAAWDSNYMRETDYDGAPGEYWSVYDTRPSGQMHYRQYYLYIYCEGYNLWYSSPNAFWNGCSFGHLHGGTGYFGYDQTGSAATYWPNIDLTSRIQSYGLPVNLGTIGPFGIRSPSTYTISYSGTTYGSHSGGASAYSSGQATTVSLGTYTANSATGYTYSLSLSCSVAGCTISTSGSISSPGSTMTATLTIPASVSGNITITASWGRSLQQYSITYSQVSGEGAYASHSGGTTYYTKSSSSQSKSMGTWTAASNTNYNYDLHLSASAGTLSQTTYYLSASGTASPNLTIPANTTGNITINYYCDRSTIIITCTKCLGELDITPVCLKCKGSFEALCTSCTTASDGSTCTRCIRTQAS